MAVKNSKIGIIDVLIASIPYITIIGIGWGVYKGAVYLIGLI